MPGPTTPLDSLHAQGRRHVTDHCRVGPTDARLPLNRAMNERSAPRINRRGRQLLLIAVGLSALIYLVPQLQWLAQALALTGTLVHELGHGLTAILIGEQFQSMVIRPDRSGYAMYSLGTTPLQDALVALGGLLAPALCATAFYALCARPRGARLALTVFTVIMAMAVVFWVRDRFGVLYISLLAFITGYSALRLPAFSTYLGVFIACQLALSVFSRVDYLFQPGVTTAAGRVPSDTALVERGLGLPYWLCAAVLCGLSVALLIYGMRRLLRP